MQTWSSAWGEQPIEHADEVTLSRKGAKSRTGGRKLRSTGTRLRARVAHGRGSIERLQQQLDTRTRELAEAQRHADEARRQAAEAVEQQTATSEVLRVIATSPGDLGPVFEVILSDATRLCAAKFGVLFRSEGDALRAVALNGAPPAYAEERQRNPVIRPAPETLLGRAQAMKHAVQIADIRDEPAPSMSGTTAVSGTTAAQLVCWRPKDLPSPL
jgi:hypothetical protein